MSVNHGVIHMAVTVRISENNDQPSAADCELSYSEKVSMFTFCWVPCFNFPPIFTVY